MLRLNILLLLFVSFLSIEIFSQRTSEWEVLQSPTTDLLRKLFLWILKMVGQQDLPEQSFTLQMLEIRGHFKTAMLQLQL